MADKQQNPPLNRVPGQPEGQDDMINKFGTYQVQATCGRENEYPSIGQEACPKRPKKLGN